METEVGKKTWLINLIFLIVLFYCGMKLYHISYFVYFYITLSMDIPLLQVVQVLSPTITKLVIGLTCFFALWQRLNLAKILFSIICIGGMYGSTVALALDIYSLQNITNDDSYRVYGAIYSSLMFIGSQIFLILYIWFSDGAEKFFLRRA